MIDVPCMHKRCSVGISAVDVSIAAGEIDRTIPQLSAPFNNPPSSTVTTVEVTDPCHPLFGRRFELFAPGGSSPHASVVTVLYHDPIRLRIPVTATDLAPARHGPVSKLTLAAVTELVTLMERVGWGDEGTPT